MTWTRALHKDVIPTFLKAGAFKIRTFVERKIHEIEGRERSPNADSKAAWWDKSTARNQGKNDDEGSARVSC